MGAARHGAGAALLHRGGPHRRRMGRARGRVTAWIPPRGRDPATRVEIRRFEPWRSDCETAIGEMGMMMMMLMVVRNG